eukprot:1175706-Prorocentrum_minimum.AAC.1
MSSRGRQWGRMGVAACIRSRNVSCPHLQPSRRRGPLIGHFVCPCSSPPRVPLFRASSPLPAPAPFGHPLPASPRPARPLSGLALPLVCCSGSPPGSSADWSQGGGPS